MRLVTYLFLIIGIMILFNLAGLSTAGSIIADQLGIEEGNLMAFKGSAIYLLLIASAALLAGVTGVIIGIFGRSMSEIAVTALLATPLFAFIGDLIVIATSASAEGGIIGYVVFLIMAPLIVGYAFAVYDWIRGKD